MIDQTLIVFNSLSSLAAVAARLTVSALRPLRSATNGVRRGAMPPPAVLVQTDDDEVIAHEAGAVLRIRWERCHDR